MTTTAAPTDRGRTTIADAVVERIAVGLVGEFDDIGGAGRRILSLPVGSTGFGSDAVVTARVENGVVTATVRCSVTYPAPVASSTEALRTHLTTRLAELTGLRVRRVDIVVTALHAVEQRRVS